MAKPYEKCEKKSEKYETFCVSKLPIWRRHGTSLAVWVLPGRVILLLWYFEQNMLFLVKLIKLGILKWTIRRGQSNFSIAFVFVSFEEKGYCRVVSVGQLTFDCRSYCGRSRRMQGCFYRGNKRKMILSQSAHVFSMGYFLNEFNIEYSLYIGSSFNSLF